MKNKILLLTTLFASSLMAESLAIKTQDKDDTIVVSDNNLIILNREIMSSTMGTIILKAKELDSALSSSLTNKAKEKLSGKKTPLYIFVNSPGGSIQTGLEAAESVKGLSRPVHTITLFAASMAFQLVQQFDTRYVLRNGVMMSHRAAGGFEGSFGGQFPSQLDSRYALWMKRLTEMDEQTVKRTNGKQTLASYQKQYADEMWLTGSQSTEQGYSDAVVSVKCDESLSGVRTVSAKIDLGFGTVSVTYEQDKCPTNTNPMNVRPTIETNKGDMEISKFQSLGGEFSAVCLREAIIDQNKVCALDPTLDLAKIYDAVVKFEQQGQFDFHNWKPSQIKTVW